MRIGINALYFIPGGVGGTEIYLRELLTGLAAIDNKNQYFVFTNRETGPDLVPQLPNFQQVPQPVRAKFRPARILWEQTGLPLAARRFRIDVMFNPGFTCPAWSCCPNVTVFHDLQHKRHPEYFRWFDLPFWRLLLWLSARRSRELISVSRVTAADLQHFYGRESTVIHHGVEREFFRIAERRTPGDYLLCVSTLHPHKNLDRLVRVYGMSGQLPHLVITGLRGHAAAELEKLAGPCVRFTGWVARDELYSMFRGARAFIYPSKFEGFGMPVLEAMAAGIPVACSDIPPLREIADGCAIFFDPEDDHAMQEAIIRVMQDNSLIQTARQRAAAFSWQRSARATLDCIERAVTR